VPEASTDQFGSLSCEEKRYQKSRGPRTVKTGQLRIARSRFQQRSAARRGNCQHSITKLSFYLRGKEKFTDGHLPGVTTKRRPTQ